MRYWIEQNLFALVILMMTSVPGAPAPGELRLPALFGDHMVLQAGQPIPVWGWSAPGDTITVSFAGQTRIAVADIAGRWQVSLDPLVASAVPAELSVRSALGPPLGFGDVLVGEVWLCSGQSNMGLPIREAEGGEEAAIAAHSPLVRLFRVPERVALDPQPDLQSSWTGCTLSTVAEFSAVGFFFAEQLQRDLGTPVGVIQAAYGGAVAEAFVSPQALAEPRFAPILQTWERFIREYPATPEARAQVAEARRQQLIASGKVPPPWPLDPKPADHFHRPSSLFNGMIHPLIPYALRGVLWYQGEANGWRGYQYRDLLPGLIADWRRQWGRPELPFLFVQLPGFEADWLEQDVWPELREAQLLTWRRVPHTAMVEAIDVGDPWEIHPRQKREIGRRLELAALATVYGRQVEFSGPVFRSLERQGQRVRLSFDHVTGGLIGKGEELAGFTIAGPDRGFVPATAVVEGETIVVWSDQVEAPAAVRYGWSNAPAASLFNGAGLPASPFRTDDWPGITQGRVEPEAY